MFRLVLVSLLFSSFFLGSCGQNQTSAVGKGGWLEGTTDEKLDIVAKHLRGNDLVMWEVGYRHQELRRAGGHENWPLAEYQLKKISLAMHMGAERRPGRQASYTWFFETAVPVMQQAIASENSESFAGEFARFSEHCNTCHQMEKVPFFHVTLNGVE
jgi:hypothetical protein